MSENKILSVIGGTGDVVTDPYENLYGKLFVTKEEKNKVKRLLENAICPPHNIASIGYNNILMVGLQNSGKTTLINFLLELLLKHFSNEINIQFTNSMQYNFDHLFDIFYNALITDDAIEMQDSYQGIGKPSIELSHQFFDIRHIIEDRFSRESGYALTIWGTQMYRALQKRLRQAPITIFTSVMNDKEENQFLFETLGAPYYKFLEKKSKYIYLLNRYDYNRFCVVKALDDIYYFEFDQPSLHMKKKKVNRKETDLDIAILTDLLPKSNKSFTREYIYEIFSYIYSREPKNLKNPTDIEKEYIRTLYKKGVHMPKLEKLFRRSTDTLSNAIHRKPKTD